MADDQLDENKPIELTAEDEKIAAKRAKKRDLSPEQAELQRKQEINFKKAQALIQEFQIKMNSLGFTLQPALRYSDYGIKPANDLRALSLEEMNRHEAMLAALKVEPEEPKESVPEEIGSGQEPAAMDIPA